MTSGPVFNATMLYFLIESIMFHIYSVIIWFYTSSLEVKPCRTGQLLSRHKQYVTDMRYLLNQAGSQIMLIGSEDDCAMTTIFLFLWPSPAQPLVRLHGKELQQPISSQH